MKKFSGAFPWNCRNLPKSAEKMGNGAAEAPFPEAEAGQGPQPVPGPDVPTAQAEGGMQPADPKEQGGGQLRQPGETGVKGPQGIGDGAQQHPRQNTAQQPLAHKRRIHRSSPRFRPGWG